MESLQQPIRNQPIEEHERLLGDKLGAIKLKYVELIFSKKLPPMEEKVKMDREVDGKWEEVEEDLKIDDLGFLLRRYSSVLQHYVNFKRQQQKQEGIEWSSENYDVIEEEFKNKIKELYDTDPEHWIEKTFDLLEIERAKIKPEDKEDDDSEHEVDETQGQAGIINYYVDGGFGRWFENSEVPVDIQDKDTCMSIHFEAFFKQANKNPNISKSPLKALEDSLKELAVKIVTKFPETKAIIAQSWLVDTKRMKDIGFEVYKKENYSFHGSFWQQFVNIKGQIDTERVKKFLETGEAPHQVATGAIMVEDFLKKYLPAEYKGKPLILKEANPDFNQKQLNKENASFRELLLNFENVSISDIQKVIDESIAIKDFNESEYGKGLFDLIFTVKKEGKTKEEIEKDERFANYRKSLEEFVKTKKFINKEVIIE